MTNIRGHLPTSIYAGLLLILLASLYAPAQVWAGDLEITPIIGYVFGGGFEDSANGNRLDLADTENYGIILSLRDKSKPGGFYELLYSHQSTYLKGDGTVLSGDSRLHIDIDTIQIGGTYGTEGENVNPFVAAGVGVTHMSPEQGDAETRFSFSLGAGVKVPLSENIGLRIEGRGFATVFDGSGSLFCSNGSCEIQAQGDTMWQFSAFSGVAFSF